MNYKHRVGRFELPMADVGRHGLDLAPAFAGLVVVECRYDFAREVLIYLSLGPGFAEIPMGSEAPWYDLTIRSRGGKIEGATFTPRPGS